MEALLTWRYFLIPEDKFAQIKPKADELDTLRNRELSPEESARQEELIDEINAIAPTIAYKQAIYNDEEGAKKDGTVIEELVYRMDEAPSMRAYSEEFYFPFMVYITPEDLQEQYSKIEEIFEEIADHDLLKVEFLGKWEYLERAREIFAEIREMYKEAQGNKCGIIKTDKLEWTGEPEEEDTEEIEENTETAKEEVVEALEA